MPRQGLRLDAAHQRLRRDVRVADAAVERHQEVQPGRRAVHDRAGQMRGQRLDHHVPPPPVPSAQRPQVPFQVARLHEPGEDELRQQGVAEVRQPLGGDDVVVQVAGHQEPAHPQRRGQQLGDAPRVADVVRKQGAQRRHGRAAVAVLGVVVVLDHQPAVGGPLHELPPAVPAQDHAGRELVGGCDQDGARSRPAQGVHPQAVRVHGHRGRGDAPPGQLLPDAERTRILHRHLGRAPGAQHPRQQGERLGHTAHDDDLLGLRPDAPVAGQPVGDRPAEARGTVRIAVPQLGRGEPAEQGALGAQPGGPGEGRQVGPAR
ncbi:hypothetical protein GCM10023347_29720 [Streptomyces chumphonensis]